MCILCFQHGNGGSIVRIVDKELGSSVLRIKGDYDGSVNMFCPKNPKDSLKMKVPILVLAVRELNRAYASIQLEVSEELFYKSSSG